MTVSSALSRGQDQCMERTGVKKLSRRLRVFSQTGRTTYRQTIAAQSATGIRDWITADGLSLSCSPHKGTKTSAIRKLLNRNHKPCRGGDAPLWNSTDAIVLAQGAE